MKTGFKSGALFCATVLTACATLNAPEVRIDQQYLESYGSPVVYEIIKGQPLWRLPQTQAALDKIDVALRDENLTDFGRLALTNYRAKILNGRDDRDGVKASYANLAKVVNDPKLKQYLETRAPLKRDEAALALEPKPLVRIPPVMPPNANNSGYCRMEFDVQPSGDPANVKALYCTRDLFERSAVTAVSRWKYSAPPSGETYSGIQTQMSFQLINSLGEVLPY